jgi:hypothetical protein
MKALKKTILLILGAAILVFMISLILNWDDFMKGFEAGCKCG